MPDNQLGEFLRARRAALSPEDAALPSHGRRRVSGLRREEVAFLARMSADYYTRLEQGRERRPSPPLLDALARALRLDPDARTHLHRLAGTTRPGPPAPVDRREISPFLRRMLDGFTTAPAFVINGTLDVLAANAPADALYAPFTPADNLARMVFLDPAAQPFHTRWADTAEAVAAHLRHTAGLAPDSAPLRHLVRDLTTRSAYFAHLWTTHTVRGKTSDTKHFHHPEAGPLTFAHQAFDVCAAPGLQLVVYQPAPDPATSASTARGLALLASRATSTRPVQGTESGLQQPVAHRDPLQGGADPVLQGQLRRPPQ
ncbi:XRE family transcriptional regulator [Streptomyces sp. WAC07149]|uniref:helix-turn-helix transcriptional regulator n=1 Tax=Streptomyces sp. WAC07149 TaxID=2487425 RepID=UPI000F7B92DA|nr:helix-turn-helix transcriptional regulator [Streptomyces sp. WAC07149]RST08859.1 XRE family transcriptional regulator [Streptomyces sp. WAC07149]